VLTVDLAEADYEALRAVAEKNQMPLAALVSELVQSFLKYR
jgi:predicted DNA-binding ribbon-helix-helix protein